jgi:hypothetical protein
MKNRDAFDDTPDDNEDGELTLALESARNNFKRLITSNPRYFSNIGLLKNPQEIINTAKKIHKQNRHFSMKKVAIESYCLDSELNEAQRKFLREALEFK